MPPVNSEAKYLKIDGISSPTTWPEIFAATERIELFFEALSENFVEREDLIRKIKYAFLMREHVLVSGPTGAAKSKLIDVLFGRIKGAKLWSMDLTKFTGDTHLFGNYDMTEMNKSGQLKHMTDGSIAEANFAKTGEFFDASDATLRTLLGVLNERVVKRGPQVMRPPLVSVIADTNFEPEKMPQRRESLDAVVDRFLFRTKIAYVKEPKNRYRMLDMSLENSFSDGLPEITFEDIELVSGAVLGMNLVRDRYIKEAYQAMTHEFSQARIAAGRSPLSDRRFVRAAHIMEVCALLNGREEVTFDDIKISRHILCQIEDDEKLLETARENAIKAWSEKSLRRHIDLEMASLMEIASKMPSTTDVTKLSLVDLDDLIRRLDVARQEMLAFKPESIEVQSLHVKQIGHVSDLLVSAESVIFDRLLENLPKVDENTRPEQLGPMMIALNRLHEEIKSIRPGSERTVAKQMDALNAIYKVRADIEAELAGPARRSLLVPPVKKKP